MEELNKCEKCLQNKDKLLICGKCRMVEYCSKECQVSHWPKHKKLCGITDEEICQFLSNKCLRHKSTDIFQVNLQALKGLNKNNLIYIDSNDVLNIYTFDEFGEIINQKKNNTLSQTFISSTELLAKEKTEEIMIVVEFKISEKIMRYAVFFDLPPI